MIAVSLVFALVFTAVFALFLVSGYFPSPVRAQRLRSLPGSVLIHAIWVMALVVFVHAVAIWLSRLHWSYALIAAGLAVLAAPPLQQATAWFFGDRPDRLGLLLLFMMAALVLAWVV